MIVFPNCKINLGLYVTHKLPTGYHNLETCFYPIPWRDVLEIIELPAGSETTITFSGIPVDTNAPNSCLAAYGLLKKLAPQLAPVAIHLHKAIPIGGGLGGGSADGAFMLQLLNQKFELQLDEETLLKLALELGSDSPFFIKNTPCVAQGRGEQLQPIALDLSQYKFVLVNPNIHVSTGWAFTQLQLQRPQKEMAELLLQPVETWTGQLLNIFEPPVFSRYPEIARIKQQLYDTGAVYAAMSGSGATVYGLFKKLDVVSLSFPPHYLVKEC